MTREEAIEFGKKILCIAHPQKDASAYEFTQMAISALEQEPCEDAISRKAVLEKAVYTETEEGWWGYRVDVDYIKSLPSVTPSRQVIEDIKAEITYFRDGWKKDGYDDEADALDKALEIIDKHTK